MKNLSIIIPCYNEKENIKILLGKFVSIKDQNIELILVNNGSSDSTEKTISSYSRSDHRIRYVKIEKNIGYGNGIMAGVSESRNKIISWTHADLQTDILDVINSFYSFITHEDYKQCVLKGKRKRRSVFDWFFTFSMSIISSVLLGRYLSDINAQPKMFHRSFLKKLKNYPKDFSLDLFFLYQAKSNAMKIIEYPVYFGKRLYGESKGGGTIAGKLKLIARTWSYMIQLRKKIK